jgi:hypothetical protein
MLPWMTPEIIGPERYELLPMKYKKQRSQTRQGGRFTSSAHLAEEVCMTDLEDPQRHEDWKESRRGVEGSQKECVVEPFRPSMLEESPKCKSERWCEINSAISMERMREYGVNTVHETEAFQDIFEGVAMALGKEYFKEEIKAASDGHRGQPKPDPNSPESRRFCKSDDEGYYTGMDPAAKAEHEEYMNSDCVEHPAKNGRATHPNCCCCSVWHPDRHSPRMYLTWPERLEYWKEVQMTDEVQRRGKHARVVTLVKKHIDERKKLEA